MEIDVEFLAKWGVVFQFRYSEGTKAKIIRDI